MSEEVRTAQRGGMTEEARQAQREYFRKWRQENPAKVKEAKRRYWERKAAAAKVEKAKQGKLEQ